MKLWNDAPDSWVSVEAALPLKSGRYKCRLKGARGIVPNTVEECYFDAEKGYFVIETIHDSFKTTRVTHWTEAR